LANSWPSATVRDRRITSAITSCRTRGAHVCQSAERTIVSRHILEPTGKGNPRRWWAPWRRHGKRSAAWLRSARAQAPAFRPVRANAARTGGEGRRCGQYNGVLIHTPHTVSPDSTRDHVEAVTSLLTDTALRLRLRPMPSGHRTRMGSDLKLRRVAGHPRGRILVSGTRCLHPRMDRSRW
jgi:hypothetical protein